MSRACLRSLAAMLLLGSAAPASAAGDSPALPAPRRAVSSRVAQMLSDATKRIEPPAPIEKIDPVAPPQADDRRSPGVTSRSTEPANRIVRLPEYLITAPKLPKPEEVLTEAELTKLAMNRYLGDEQDLDRALSMITPVHLWRKIPLLGRFPFLGFETNEQRALRIYREEKRKEAWENLLGIQAIGVSAPAASPKK